MDNKNNEGKFIELASTIRDKSIKAIRQKFRNDIDSICTDIEGAADAGLLSLHISATYSMNKELLEFFRHMGYNIEIQSDEKTRICTQVIIRW